MTFGGGGGGGGGMGGAGGSGGSGKRRSMSTLMALFFFAFTILLIPLVILPWYYTSRSWQQNGNGSSSSPAMLELMRAKTSMSSLLHTQIANRVAWAIPVGGRTQRLDRLQELLRDLIAYGAGRHNIYVFEDNGSRSDPLLSEQLAAITRAWGVRLFQSHVSRADGEPAYLFGLHLARHYHFMLDTLLLPRNAAELNLDPAPASTEHLGYDFIMLLEDDLKLSPDAVHFFHAMSGVMDADPSLLCVSGHADNAFYATSRSDLELIMLHHHDQPASSSSSSSSRTRSRSFSLDDADAAAAAGAAAADPDTADAADSFPLDIPTIDPSLYAGTVSAGSDLREHAARVASPFPSLANVHKKRLYVSPIDIAEMLQSPYSDDHSPSSSAAASSPSSSSSPSPSSSLLRFSPLEFDFRRGQHFMAPGWMTSAKVYEHLRPTWFDASGNLKFRQEFSMPNGNWDAFFDSRAYQLGMECIYPEVPRIAHKGANGYTVSARAQAELFDNLRLSTLPATVDYGDLTRLELDQYDRDVVRFMRGCTRVFSLTSISHFRRSNLCILLPTQSDIDPLFTAVFGGFFGIVSIGGHANFGRQRAIHRGVVFTRWMTNLVAIVGLHGELSEPFLAMHGVADEEKVLDIARMQAEGKSADGVIHELVTVNDRGCYADDRSNRLLPSFVGHLDSLSPFTCMQACALQGHRYAGLQWGWECWCGDALPSARKTDDGRCNRQCVNSWDMKMMEEQNSASLPAVNKGCGGDLTLSVYETWVSGPLDAAQVRSVAAAQRAAYVQDVQEVLAEVKAANRQLDLTDVVPFPAPVHVLNRPDEDLEVVVADPGQSCSDACAARAMSCDDALLAVISRDCDRLQTLLGCTECVEPESPWIGFASPGQERPNRTATTLGAVVMRRVLLQEGGGGGGGEQVVMEEVEIEVEAPVDHFALAPDDVNAPAGWGPDLTKRVPKKKKTKRVKRVPASSSAEPLPALVEQKPAEQPQEWPAVVEQKPAEQPQELPAVVEQPPAVEQPAPQQPEPVVQPPPVEQKPVEEQAPPPTPPPPTPEVTYKPEPCVLSRGKYLRCDAVAPSSHFVRACSCVRS